MTEREYRIIAIMEYIREANDNLIEIVYRLLMNAEADLSELQQETAAHR